MVSPLFCGMLKSPSQIWSTRLAYISDLLNDVTFAFVPTLLESSKVIKHKPLVLLNLQKGDYAANTLRQKSNILFYLEKI